jgi:hypothetical protein
MRCPRNTRGSPADASAGEFTGGFELEQLAKKPHDKARNKGRREDMTVGYTLWPFSPCM